MKRINLSFLLILMCPFQLLLAAEGSPVSALSEDEVGHLGTWSESLLRANLVREKVATTRRHNDYFSVTTARWEFFDAYKRFVGWRDTKLVTEPQTIEVQKYADSNGISYFPTVASKSLIVHFSYVSKSDIQEIEVLKARLNEMAPGSEVLLQGNRLHVNLPSVFEFDFGPNNFGVTISKLSRVTKEQKLELIRAHFAYIINDPVLGKKWDLDNLSQDDLNRLYSAHEPTLREIEIEKVDANRLEFSRYGDTFNADVIASLHSDALRLVSVANQFYTITSLNSGSTNHILSKTEDITHTVSRVYGTGDTARALLDHGATKRYPLLNGREPRYVIGQLVTISNSEDIRFIKDPDTLRFVQLLRTNAGQVSEVELNFEFENDDLNAPKTITLLAKTRSGTNASLKLPIGYRSHSAMDWKEKKTNYLTAENQDIKIVVNQFSATTILQNGRAFLGGNDSKENGLPQINIEIVSAPTLPVIGDNSWASWFLYKVLNLTADFNS